MVRNLEEWADSIHGPTAEANANSTIARTDPFPEHIKFGAKGKYPPEKILMIGDAPGDFKAAKSNGALFFPVNPGKEEISWKRFYEEALDRFFAGTYDGSYEAGLVKEFDSCLPEKPNW